MKKVVVNNLINKMKIAVVGAGPAGLVSAKNAIANNFECDVFEMRDQLGGTWLYTDEAITDEGGFPVFSATYKSLKTNVSKEVMGFPDFPVPDYFDAYGTHESQLRFLKLYTEHFNLRRLIKVQFKHLVKDVRPTGDGDGKWSVTVLNRIDGVTSTGVYDVVMLCSGNFNEPVIPDFPGRESFQGKQFHSQHYRTPAPYAGQNILVVGGGPSGADLALEVASVAKKVAFSHHSKILKTRFPSNVEIKPDVRCFGSQEVEFEDGSTFRCDAIFFCTGFRYSFPYLHESCGVKIEDNFLSPLYKHVIHMERPSMCFIGLPVHVCAFPLFDLQVRFYMKYLDGTMELPKLERMREITRKEMEVRWANGYRKKEAHKMAKFQRVYYDDLATLAGIVSIPPVIIKIRDRGMERLHEDLIGFRGDVYKILDDDNFIHYPQQK